MKINIEELKQLVEAGDTTAIAQHVLKSLEKGDVKAATEVNTEVLSEVDSLKDTHYNTAFNTFKQDKLPLLLEKAKDEVRKELAPNETPEQIQIRELQAQIKQEKQTRVRAEVLAKALELATGEEIGLDATFAQKHIGKYIPAEFKVAENGEVDVESVLNDVKTGLTDLSTDLKTFVSTSVEKAMVGATRNPVPGTPGTPKIESVGERLAKNSIQAQGTQESKFF